MPRKPDLACAICGELMWRGTTSSPEGRASHPGCRPFPHGTATGYKRRCRCAECAEAKRLEMVDYVQMVKLRDGLSPTQKCRPPKTAKVCRDCGKDLPMGGWRCRECHQANRSKRRRAASRRKRLELKLLRAQEGTHGSSVWVAGECAQCLTSFVRRGTASRFCSKACSRKTKGRWKVAMRDRLAIYERDGWVCQLCLEPADRDLMATNPLSDWAPSLDHIEPQSWALIPDHSAANLRLAHRWCNSVRGDLTYYSELDLRTA